MDDLNDGSSLGKQLCTNLLLKSLTLFTLLSNVIPEVVHPVDVAACRLASGPGWSTLAGLVSVDQAVGASLHPDRHQIKKDNYCVALKWCSPGSGALAHMDKLGPELCLF